jgi:hypothetical protein
MAIHQQVCINMCTTKSVLRGHLWYKENVVF